MTRTFLLHAAWLALAGALMAGIGPAAAAQAPPPSVTLSRPVDSGAWSNPTDTERLVWQHLLQVPGAAWLQLRFAAYRLPGGSRLELESFRDGAVQPFTAQTLAQWFPYSAYFNGDAVILRLFAGPRTEGVRIAVESVIMGLPPVIDTICGPTDDRVPSNDKRVGRIMPIGCTGWIATQQGLILTAGHCASSRAQIIEFNVPPSLSNGQIQHPPPQDQYAMGTRLGSRAAGVGCDWAVYRPGTNSQNQTPLQRQGAYFTLATSIPGSGTTFRVTGYGVDSGVRNQVQQTHTGPSQGTRNGTCGPYRLTYRVDTMGGNSGSPVIHEATGLAIGIHTHGGCTSSGGFNSGTAITNPDLQRVLNPPPPPGPLPKGGAAVTAGRTSPFTGDDVLFVDTVRCTTASCPFPSPEGTRGLTWGYDGALYVTGWTTNGILRLEPSTCRWSVVCTDPSNQVVGAPYQIAVNNEAIGGPGLFGFDGNPPGPGAWRNTFLVNIQGSTCTIGCIFPNTFTPMSDTYAHPLQCETFLGVGYGTNDMLVTAYPLSTTGTLVCTPRTVCSLQYPPSFDALIHEDMALYVWTAGTTGTLNFAGFQRVDLATGRCTTCRLPIPTAANSNNTAAAVWNEPWEMPGRVAYVLYSQDDRLYRVDLKQCAVLNVCRPGTTSTAAGFYNSGREKEESQLTSWLVTRGGQRVFHLNFGSSAAGATYVLVPSITPPTVPAPLVVSGLELWFAFDPVSAAGLLGALPYTPVGTLDSSGRAAVRWTLNQVGVCAWWIAGVIRQGALVDVSNVIVVKM